MRIFVIAAFAALIVAGAAQASPLPVATGAATAGDVMTQVRDRGMSHDGMRGMRHGKRRGGMHGMGHGRGMSGMRHGGGMRNMRGMNHGAM